MSSRPRIIFDTTGINHLEDGGDASEPLMRGLESLEVILTAMNANEIIASAKDPIRREALLRRFCRLLSSATCIWSPNKVLRLLISSHQRDPSQFNWHSISVRAVPYEDAILGRKFDDQRCAQQRRSQLKVQREFERGWKSIRPDFDPVFAKAPAKRPKHYSEVAKNASRSGGVLWSIAKSLYQLLGGKPISEPEVRVFIDQCPPFRAACFGLVMAEFNWALRPTHDLPPLPGRNDLLMAIYLPYCERFVTGDQAQRRDLAQVASAANLACDVISFEDFNNGFVLNVASDARPSTCV